MKLSDGRKSRLSTKLWQWLFYLRRRLQRVRDRPHSIACGLGLGSFAACLPLFGGQTAIGVLLALVFRGNKLCAALATWFSNPVTYVPLFWLNYNLGLWLLPDFQAPDRLRWDSFDDMLVQMRGISIPLSVGSIVMGLLLGTMVYAVSLFILMARSKRIQRRTRIQQQQRQQQAHGAQQECSSRGLSESPARVSSGKPTKIVEYNQ